MPYTKVMIHYIWAAKNRANLITPELKQQLIPHIRDNSVKKGIYIDSLNCVTDHIHLLVSLGTEQTISKVSQLIKGESSFWINRANIIRSKFEWQDEYIALSVSESGIDKVRLYIANQEEHHKVKTFSQEYDDFLKVHGLERQAFG
jgi:REP element-mobilizing transposase RayT